jgi:hypothetical protein
MLLHLHDVPGVFCDAHLVDESGVCRFLSLWGRDTALQELLARLTLPERDGGIRSFWIGESGEKGAAFVPAFDPEPLVRISARRTGTLFGDLVHVWLHDRLATEPDRANGRALLLHRTPGDDPEASMALWDALWRVVQQVLWVPVQPHWQRPLIQRLEGLDCIRALRGHRVQGYLLNLSDRERIEAEISTMVRFGTLTLEAGQGAGCKEATAAAA